MIPLGTESTADPLRATCCRASQSPLASQIDECIDQLQNPDLIIADLLESAVQAVERGEAELAEFAASTPAYFVDTGGEIASPDDDYELVLDEVYVGEEVDADEGPPELVLENALISERDVERARSEEKPPFYPSRDLAVVRGNGSSFTCIAAPANPWAGLGGTREDLRFGFDFTAVSCDARRAPMVGIVQDADGTSPYPMLLRGLAGIVDLLAAPLLARFDGEGFRGMLGEAPRIDLALVIWDDGEEAWERTPVCQFTRDLAELLREAWERETRVPDLLGYIHCLRMNPKRFDGRLRAEWRA